MDEYNTRSSLSIPNSLSNSYLLREPLGISTTMLMMLGISAPAGTSFHRLIMRLLKMSVSAASIVTSFTGNRQCLQLGHAVSRRLVEVCYNRNEQSAISNYQSA